MYNVQNKTKYTIWQEIIEARIATKNNITPTVKGSMESTAGVFNLNMVVIVIIPKIMRKGNKYKIATLSVAPIKILSILLNI